jgi:glucosamine--fructose-6-phosphate aminotransferase (isomerizing)
MCGIVGYVGRKEAKDILIAGLKKLEYRGYDSCGIATIKGDSFKIRKTINRIDGLESDAQNLENSNIGIGHTRWATHGGVTETNAHPHISNDNTVVIRLCIFLKDYFS